MDIISLDSIPADILEAANKVSKWAEMNGGRYWQLGRCCDLRYAYRNPFACGDCDPCLFGRPDQCAVSPLPKNG